MPDRRAARALASLAALAALCGAAGCASAFPAIGAPVSLGKALVEIALFFIVFLAIQWFMRGTRGENILKGIGTLFFASFLGLYYLAQTLSLDRLNSALDRVFSASVIALLVIFQPELRRGLVRLGENPLVRLFIRREGSVIGELVESVVRLAKKKVGALIAIEREIGLRTYIEGGVRVDGEVRAELIDTIFFPGTALHDGAVVIQSDRVAAAGCLFPLTDNPSISKSLGTRHRAAIGLTEETDAVTIVVSEETGQISIGVDGELHRNLDKEGLETLLRQLVVTGEGAPSPGTGKGAESGGLR